MLKTVIDFDLFYLFFFIHYYYLSVVSIGQLRESKQRNILKFEVSDTLMQLTYLLSFMFPWSHPWEGGMWWEKTIHPQRIKWFPKAKSWILKTWRKKKYDYILLLSWFSFSKKITESAEIAKVRVIFINVDR